MGPGVIARRAANALIANAEARLPPFTPGIRQIAPTLDRFKSAHGGLWVGGQATLTTEAVSFRPNAVNRGIQVGSLDLEIPLPDIVRLEVLPALVSSVIAIHTPELTVKIRCFRAASFAGQIAQLARVDLQKAAGGRFQLRLNGD